MDGLRVHKANVYLKDMGILKKYTDSFYKLVWMRSLRQKGYEDPDDNKKGKKGSAGNLSKLDESIIRTKSTLFELATCNPWELFVTLTLSPETRDRKDLNAFKKELSKWINNYNYQNGLDIKYLLIPEPHKDGAWHMHGLVMGLPLDRLTEFKLADNIPSRIKDLILQGRKIYNWIPYSNKFGWVTAELILDKSKCARYITKYITKELINTRISLNDHLFYCSKGLKRADVILKSEIRQAFIPDFENDYVKIKKFDNVEEPLKYFCDAEE